MKTTNKTTARKERKVILSTLWIFATLNYIYCDVVAVMDPVKHAPFQLTQGFLLGASILVEIPIAMVLLSRALGYGANRWANIVAGIVMTIVQIMSLFVAVPAMYYVFFSLVEISTTALIVWYAWTWSHPESGVRTHADSGLLNVRQSEQEEAKRQVLNSTSRK